MSGSVYLQPEEYADFGLPITVTPALVLGASNHIDGFLKRPGGLVWSPDATGAPAYMPALPTTLRLQGASPISPGQNVVIPYGGAQLDNNYVGEVVILDKSVANKVEACIVKEIGTNTITLLSVANSHDTNCTIEFGLVLMEQKEMPRNRPVTRLSQWPIMKLQSGVGRYGLGRRSDQILGNYQDLNLLATVSGFGGPPLWVPFETMNASYNQKTGEVWVPPGILLAYYTDVKLWYVAGWKQSDLPREIKQACANIINQTKDSAIGANIRRREQTTGTATSKFENDIIDFNTRQMLQPFVARQMA